MNKEIVKHITALRKEKNEIEELELHQFRSAMMSNLKLLFNKHGKFCYYGIDSCYPIQYNCWNETYTKQNIIEQINEDIKRLKEYL